MPTWYNTGTIQSFPAPRTDRRLDVQTYLWMLPIRTRTTRQSVRSVAGGHDTFNYNMTTS